MMDIRPLRDEANHAAALAEIDRLWDAPEGGPEADKMEVLAILVEEYESRQHAFPRATPLEILRYSIAEMGRTQSELAEIVGSRSRASELLSGKRRLTVANIHAISKAWHIPPEVLVAPYKVESAA